MERLPQTDPFALESGEMSKTRRPTRIKRTPERALATAHVIAREHGRDLFRMLVASAIETGRDIRPLDLAGAAYELALSYELEALRAAELAAQGVPYKPHAAPRKEALQ